MAEAADDHAAAQPDHDRPDREGHRYGDKTCHKGHWRRRDQVLELVLERVTRHEHHYPARHVNGAKNNAAYARSRRSRQPVFRSYATVRTTALPKVQGRAINLPHSSSSLHTIVL